MTEDQIEVGRIYEYKTGRKIAPVKITDRGDGKFFMALNLDTDRELVSRNFLQEI